LMNAGRLAPAFERLLRPITSKVLGGLDGAPAGSRAKDDRDRAPVRERIASMAPQEQRWTGQHGHAALLVIGGRLGARVDERTASRARWAQSRPNRRPGACPSAASGQVEERPRPRTAAAGVRRGCAASSEGGIATCYEEADWWGAGRGDHRVGTVRGRGGTAIWCPWSAYDHGTTSVYKASSWQTRGGAERAAVKPFRAEDAGAHAGEPDARTDPGRRAARPLARHTDSDGPRFAAASNRGGRIIIFIGWGGGGGGGGWVASPSPRSRS